MYKLNYTGEEVNTLLSKVDTPPCQDNIFGTQRSS